MADMPDLPEHLDGEHTHKWISRLTDEQLVEYRAYLVAERASFVDITPPTSIYRSASYRSYRYGRWIQMIDDERKSRDPAVRVQEQVRLKGMNDDLTRFARWVSGDLTSNRMRGLFAEWLLADRLGLVDERSARVEWDMVDIRFGNLAIEVKASGTRQQWSEVESSPRFSIAPQRTAWDANTNRTETRTSARRTADLYVFCLHRCSELTNTAVLDERNWQFWVVPTSRLDAALPTQKSIGLTGLSSLSQGVGLDAAVEQIKRFASGAN